MLNVEAPGEEDDAHGIHHVARSNVSCVASTFPDDLAIVRGERLNDDARLIGIDRIRRVEQREEHGAIAWQHLGPEGQFTGVEAYERVYGTAVWIHAKDRSTADR